MDYDGGSTWPDPPDSGSVHEAHKFYEYVKASVTGSSFDFDVVDDQSTSGAYIYEAKLVPANDA